MEQSIITKVNRYLRSKRPLIPSNTICEVYQNNAFMEIAFISKCCRNDAKGSCIMCDYGAGSGTRAKEVYLAEMDKILNKYMNIKFLLLCANGSIMDDSQLSEEIFKAILEKAGQTSIPHIIIETHYLDITAEKLRYIKEYLSGKSITMEIGLETSNQYFQDQLIKKDIILTDVRDKIQLIQSYGVKVDINIMLGLPFLTPGQQLEDTYQTIMWGISQNCRVIVFPINIKPYTTVMHMYKSGFYRPVSHWLILLLLERLNAPLLEKVTIAYYGNRSDEYRCAEEATIYPVACPACMKILMKFYEDFSMSQDWKIRKDLLTHALNWDKCNCLQQQRNALNETMNFDNELNNYLNLLQKEFSFL